MPTTMDYDDDTMKPVDVKDTKQLEPNAMSPSVYETGSNDLDRDKTSHPPFGKLGVKGHPA